MAHPFLQRLAQGTILCDGAMGTLLHQQGASLDTCFDELNLSSPETIVDIHRAYIAAGSDIIETNSFGANRFKLEAFGLADNVRRINRAAAKNAREAREISGNPVMIAGSVGPTGRTLEPLGTTPAEPVFDAYREQISALLEGGVDLIIIETISSLAEMEAAVRAARDVSDLPLIAQMTFAEDGHTMAGSSVEEVVSLLQGFGVDVIGANCSVGPRYVREVLSRMIAICGEGVHCSGQPNAGWPMQVSNRIIYPSSAEYFADFARDAVRLGVAVVGGCCGTTPEHIAAIAEAVRGLSPHKLPEPREAAA